jgi:hypothetical protein
MWRSVFRSGLVIATWACLAGAPPARAGTYDVYACRLPEGTPAGDDGWSVYGGGFHMATQSTCTAGRPVPGEMYAAISGDVYANATNGFAFTAPPGTSIASFTLSRAVKPVVQGTVTYLWAVTQGVDQKWSPYLLEMCGGVTSPCNTGRGSFTDAGAPANRLEAGGLQVQRIFAYVFCAYVDCPGALLEPARFVIHGARVGLQDDLAPVVSAPEGVMFHEVAPREGTKSFTVAATDAGGGIASVGLMVDGNVVVERAVNTADPACRPPYSRAVPCPLSAIVELTADTASFPNGAHEMRTFATDAAGNRGVSAPARVETRNGSIPNGTNAGHFAKLHAWFASRRGEVSARTVAYRGTVRVHGELTSSGGVPITGATIEVWSRPARVGSVARLAGTIVTDARGRFIYRPARGAARELTFGYRAFTLDDGFSATADATLNVRAGVRLDVRPAEVHNGRRVVFSGQLLGGPGRRDVAVVLYALASGPRSRIPVESLRTDVAGRFRFAYRFRSVTGVSHFRFVARVPRQSGYPYATGESRVVRVTVRG